MHAAEVLVVSLRPPPQPPPRPSPRFSLHHNNLVTDDVKADKVQQLEGKSQKKDKGFLFLWLHFINQRCLEAQRRRTPNLWYQVLQM